jgi:hypothetical protein
MHRTFGIAARPTLLGIAVVFAALCAAPASSFAGQLYNTGVDDLGNPLANGVQDTHYTVSASSPTASTTAPNLATYAVNNDGTFPQNGFWIPQADDSASAWINPTVGAQSVDPSANGFYEYQTTFTLGLNTDLSTTAIFGEWATDNCGIDILLNGVSTSNGMTNCSGPSNYAPFSAWTTFNPITSGFVIGDNTLDFIVENYGQESGNPTGLRVNANLVPGVTDTNVPEPVTISLFGAGVAGAAAMRRRKSKRT